jgi:hypothetical protein
MPDDINVVKIPTTLRYHVMEKKKDSKATLIRLWIPGWQSRSSSYPLLYVFNGPFQQAWQLPNLRFNIVPVHQADQAN